VGRPFGGLILFVDVADAFAGNAVTLCGPVAEIHDATPFGAERSMGIAGPLHPRLATGTANGRAAHFHGTADDRSRTVGMQLPLTPVGHHLECAGA
jgi:hypothetical protein